MAEGELNAVALSKFEVEAIRSRIAAYKEYMRTPEFAAEYQKGQQWAEFFRQELAKRLHDLSEADVLEVLSRLWATQMWGNKQSLANKIIAANGLDHLKNHLQRLLDSSLGVADRYEQFVSNVKYFGPAAVTEIMNCMEPTRCGIWNNLVREALRVLGMDSWVHLNKSRITGSEYEKFNSLLKAVAAELAEAGLQNVDLRMVNFFLYMAVQAPSKPARLHEGPLDHEEVCEMIAAIGNMLGFDVDTEVRISHGAKVDVVWRARIGNLGMVTYVFEVQHGRSIESLILNLQKAKTSPGVQKVIAVSDATQLERIKRETEGLPSEFRNALGFWDISDVKRVSNRLQQAMEMIRKLGLVPDSSQVQNQSRGHWT